MYKLILCVTNMERGAFKDTHVIEENIGFINERLTRLIRQHKRRSPHVFWGREIAGHEQSSLRKEDSCLAYTQI